MDIAALDRRFAIPRVAGVAAGSGGLAVVRVTNPHASAEIYLHGAHVAAFQPRGAAPVLWMSAKSRFAAGKPIRGGVPICWPWFGGHPSDAAKPAHGFARTRAWRLAAIDQLADQRTRVAFELVSDAATLALWPGRFALRYTVTVGPSLDLSLAVSNPDAGELRCEEALHTYLAVADIRRSVLRGLGGQPYIDKTRQLARLTQDAAELAIGEETDRVYLDHAGSVEIADGQRTLRVAKQDSGSTVVWNPWVAKAKAMEDFGDDEWPGMVCVETANVGARAIVVPPGGCHEMTASIAIA